MDQNQWIALVLQAAKALAENPNDLRATKARILVQSMEGTLSAKIPLTAKIINAWAKEANDLNIRVGTI
jgi:hypothetical protein